MLSSPIPKRVPDGEPGRVFFERNGHLAYFIIDGPNDLNPMTPEMNLEFFEHLIRFRDDPDLWVGILTATGARSFSAGGDLKRAIGWAETFSSEEHLRHFWYPRRAEPELTPHVSMTLSDTDVRLYKPMIAAVNGHCLGGAFIRMCVFTDIRIAVPESTFGLTEVKVGLGGGGGWAGIARQTLRGTASWLCLTGDRIDANQALRAGLINQIVPIENLMDRAHEIADGLLAQDPIQLQIEKELVLRDLEIHREETKRLASGYSILGQIPVSFGEEYIETV